MSRVLIQLQSTSEMICYEAISLAMTLATFDHEVQLTMGRASYGQLIKNDGRISAMLKSFPLYDLPIVWLIADLCEIDNNRKVKQDNIDADFLNKLQQSDKELAEQLTIKTPQIDLAQFDQVLRF